MLEIFAIIMLTIGNRKRALERGKSGGAAIAYTISLWLGMEFFGAILGVYLFGLAFGTYVFVLAFAAAGGFISWRISKKDAKLVPDVPLSTELFPPSTLHIYRDDSPIERDEKFVFSLNGEELGALDNDSMLITYTSKSQNLITSRAEHEKKERDSYLFSASSNETIQIHNTAGIFAKEQPQSALQGTNSPVSADAQGATSVFCNQCGAEQSIDSIYCNKCGNRLQKS